MTLKGESEGVEDVASLFAQRGEVGSNGGEGVGAGDGTEAAGGFLFEFGHTNIALRLIVVEGHARIGEKAQHIGGVPSQADEQIDCWGLFDTPPGKCQDKYQVDACQIDRYQRDRGALSHSGICREGSCRLRMGRWTTGGE